MDFELKEEERMVLDAAHDFAQRAVAPGAQQRDHDEAFPVDIMRQLGELGFLGVKISDEYGGAGANYLSYVLAIREMARACASTAVAMAVTNMVADAIERAGTDEQKERFLRPLMSGDLGVAAFCLSEPECGSDATALRSTAKKEGENYILEGTKQWVTSGSHAGVFLVFATLDKSKGAKGVTAFLLDKDTPGLIIGRHEEKMGLKASDTVQLVLDQAQVPAANLLGVEGGGMHIGLGGLDGGRVGIAAQAIGVGEAALEEGRRYAHDRKAFGQELAQFQATQWSIADTATELEAAWLLTLRAASLRDSGKSVTKEASMAKLYASEACCRAVDRMLQIHGGYGYTKDYPIERLYRDARVFRIYEGTSEIQRLVIARQLLAQQ